MSISKFDEVVTSDAVFVLYTQKSETSVDVFVTVDEAAAKANLQANREVYRNVKLVKYAYVDEVPVW